MRIGICGLGIIGTAISTYFGEFKNVYDKYKKIGEINNLLLCDIIFISLPTNENNGKFDMTEIYEVCNQLKNYNGQIILKSTVEPETTNLLSNKYNLSITHNPEFLTERTAIYDYFNQNHIVVGFTNKSNKQLIKDFFISSFPKCRDFTFCTSNESEVMKLVSNAFYATKIQFFTEIYLLCEKMGINYENIKTMILQNGWINSMHTDVPGHDGQISFSGKCLPKDTKILKCIMDKYNVPNKIISSVINEQSMMRK